MADRGKFLVCAVDFGTTYSGWGYSFKHEFESDPTKINLKRWYSDRDTLTTVKTPTCALLAPDGETLVDFGYRAENKYQQLVEQGEHGQYYYFRRFKMSLAKNFISRDLIIKDETGKPLKALKVFALSIEYLASDVIANIRTSQSGFKLTSSDINWVLTVPAIWSDGAKQFMREAAKEAHIDMDKLAIVYEPEAASVYCQHIPVLQNQVKLEITKMPAGTQYLILDAGGGTIDVTVHEVTENMGLKEVHHASGGEWGGILVDKAFEDLLSELFGTDVFNKFVKYATDDWLELGSLFEIKKRNVSESDDAMVALRLPPALKEMAEQENKKRISEIIKSSKFVNEIDIRNDKLLISNSLFKRLFDNAIEQTLAHLKSILNHESVKKNTMLLMVGGFSDCCLLRNAVKNKFRNNKLTMPSDPSTAVLRGAVIMGHNPKAIFERKMKKSYGMRVVPQRFDKHVEVGQSVIVGEAQKSVKYYPAQDDLKSLTLQIYSSNLKDPKSLFEDCEFVGEMEIDLSDHTNEEKKIEASITFSETEIIATAKILKTGKELSAKFNFLH